jgi:transcriptional regulator with XRE-family HTH domain
MPKIHKLSQLNLPESKPARALKIAIATGGLIAKVLAEKTGMREQTLSEFLSGARSGLRADNLEKLVDSLPVELQEVFFQEWRGQSIPQKKPTLIELIEEMDTNNPLHQSQVADAMRLIATRFFSPSPDRLEANTRESTDEARELSLLK